MLGRLATREAAEHHGLEPESEPQVNVDEYKNGELALLWNKVQDQLSQPAVHDHHQDMIGAVEAIHERLQISSQPQKLAERYYELLNDIVGVLQPYSHQSQVQRLSSTLASECKMDDIQRRIDAISAMLDISAINNEPLKQRRSQQRSKQCELFVAQVSQTLQTLGETDDEDLLILLAILETELDRSKADYTEDQLRVLRSTRDTVAQRTGTDAILKTPEWFLPWYELVVDDSDCVGTGGFGNVYRAKWLDSDVVVKLLNRGDAGNASRFSLASMMSSYWTTRSYQTTTTPNNSEEQRKVREMFAREVSVWFGLSHPNVIRLFGACHIGTLFFACEFAEKGPLDKYLRKHPNELWQKLFEAALGVQYLHARGIVHGDLKCNNILVGGDGKAKVTDFGLSSDTAAFSKGETQISGAWQWVAPECLEHGASQLSSASDIYALGMCIIEALRVVELATRMVDENKHVDVPLPWGNLGNIAVKYHVVQKRALPLRPQLCTDEQWSLVARMCAFDPSRRLKVSTVVSELGMLTSTSTEEAKTNTDAMTVTDRHVMVSERIPAAKTEDTTLMDLKKRNNFVRLVLNRLKHRSTVTTHGSVNEQWSRPSLDAVEPPQTAVRLIPAVMAEMRSITRSTHNASVTSHKVLNQVFGLLWDRLEHLATIISCRGDGDLEGLNQLIERAKRRTACLPGIQDTLIAFTQTAMSGYALHRDLDKLIEANFWHIDMEGGEIHDWRPLCFSFFDVKDDRHPQQASS
jgi:serine/threonine protein kinase